MKHPLRAAAIAAGALLCFTASQAFADLEIVQVEDGGSWFASARFITNATHQFDELRVTITNGVAATYTSGISHGSTVTLPVTRGTSGSDATTSTFDTVPTGAFTELPTPPLFPRDFSDTSWHQSGNNTSTFAVATGNDVSNLVFWVHLGPGAKTRFDGVRVVLQALNNNHVVANARAYVKASTTLGVDELTAFELVPVPAALWTGLPMLGGMILLIRRKKTRVLS